jgi:hypothetical protein
LGLLQAHLGLTETVIRELEGERAGEVLDGTYLVEDLAETLVEEPLERFVLYCQEIG